MIVVIVSNLSLYFSSPASMFGLFTGISTSNKGPRNVLSINYVKCKKKQAVNALVTSDATLTYSSSLMQAFLSKKAWIP